MKEAYAASLFWKWWWEGACQKGSLEADTAELDLHPKKKRQRGCKGADMGKRKGHSSAAALMRWAGAEACRALDFSF